jgi:sugar/nucleoside kinase (ribokinase family)
VAKPDLVAIGHVVKDLGPGRGRWRLGGTVTFAAVQAQRLGLRAAIVTRAANDIDLKAELPGIQISVTPSPVTTSFENVYVDNRRRQRVPTQAEPITYDDAPVDWRQASIVLLGPVCGELPAEVKHPFAQSLAGVSAQGWLRRLGRDRHVRRHAWDGPSFWRGCQVLFVSDEDLARRRDQLERWTAEVPVVAMTRANRGARVAVEGRWRAIDAFPAREADPTGAGDVFAASFLARYHETRDVAKATRFAAAAASLSVRRRGIDGIATRDEIEALLHDHPEIDLR